MGFFSKIKKSNASESLNADVLTVSQLTGHVKGVLESDKKLADIWVRGEVSNLTQHASGHIYFSLKDEESQIRCVFFKSRNYDSKFSLEHGMKIMVRGSVEVYAPQGSYSILVEEIQPDGLGALNLAFIQLKNKLEKEGLFSVEHKKELPKFPQVIGIITSLSGAALQDILNIIKRRYSLVRILIAPTIVQGKEAVNSIVNSIKIMNELAYVDVVILGRGGGSLEDLWCFNEEPVARAIFEARIPIISAVGHETDFTIADFVADYRAPTPSAAAETVVPDMNELKEMIINLHFRNFRAISSLIETNKSNLINISNRPIFNRPLEVLNLYYQNIDTLNYKLQTITSRIIFSRKKEFEIIESKLFALSPKSILKRGYSVVMKDNQIVKNCLDVRLNDMVKIVLSHGNLDVQVKKIMRN